MQSPKSVYILEIRRKEIYYSVVKGLDLKSCPEIVSSQDIGYQ